MYIWPSWSYKINLPSTKAYVCTGHNDYNSRYKTHSPWLIDWVNVLRPTKHKIGHFEDVLPTKLLAYILSRRTYCLGLDFRPTQRLRRHRVYIPTVTQDILLQPVLARCSALEVFTIMRNINLHFTYLLDLHSTKETKQWLWQQVQNSQQYRHNAIVQGPLPVYTTRQLTRRLSSLFSDTVAERRCCPHHRMN